MFKKVKNMKTGKQILFAVLIGFSVVAFWRGAWRIMDVYIFPGNYELSSWTTLILGLLILIITHYATKELA